MPCTYSIENDGKIVLERWSGSVSPAEILAQKSLLAEEPRISAGAAVLSDCREAEFAVSADAVLDFAKAEESMARETRIKRYGFLVRNDVYQQAQFFSEKVKQFGVTAIVFNSLDIACTWVGMEVAEVEEIMRRLDGGGT